MKIPTQFSLTQLAIATAAGLPILAVTAAIRALA